MGVVLPAVIRVQEEGWFEAPTTGVNHERLDKVGDSLKAPPQPPQPHTAKIWWSEFFFWYP